MNAVVEVATVDVVAQVSKVTVTAYANYLPLGAMTPVAASTTHAVISQGNHSISAVAPDNILMNGGLAMA